VKHRHVTALITFNDKVLAVLVEHWHVISVYNLFMVALIPKLIRVHGDIY
jgi:hypothetical protein